METSFWLSSQNLQFSINNGELYNMGISTVVLSEFDSICELQPEFWVKTVGWETLMDSLVSRVTDGDAHSHACFGISLISGLPPSLSRGIFSRRLLCLWYYIGKGRIGCLAESRLFVQLLSIFGILRRS